MSLKDALGPGGLSLCFLGGRHGGGLTHKRPTGESAHQGPQGGAWSDGTCASEGREAGGESRGLQCTSSKSAVYEPKWPVGGVPSLQGMGLPLCPDSVTRLESPPSETCVPFKNMAKDIREQSPRWLGACPCCCQTSEQLLQDAHGQLNGKIERFLCKIFVEIHAHV